MERVFMPRSDVSLSDTALEILNKFERWIAPEPIHVSLLGSEGAVVKYTTVLSLDEREARVLISELDAYESAEGEEE